MAKLRRFSATPVAEGVRLEVGKYTVFAVRNEEKDISVRVRREPRKLLRACMRIPFVRGAARLIRDVLRFFDGLGESAELHPQRPVRGTAPERLIARILHITPQSIATLLSAILIPVIGAICLYFIPEGAKQLIESSYDLPRMQLSLAVAAARVVGMFAAVWLVCRLRVFRRLLMYRGAINKVINCYEGHDEVNVHTAARYPVHTRRTEPVFLLFVMGISFMLFPLILPYGLALTALCRLLVILAVAAVFNEPFRLLENAKRSLPVRILRAPIDLLQHMTATEPHPQMLEVAVCAFDAAMGKAGDEAETEVTLDDDNGMDEELD